MRVWIAKREDRTVSLEKLILLIELLEVFALILSKISVMSRPSSNVRERLV